MSNSKSKLRQQLTGVQDAATRAEIESTIYPLMEFDVVELALVA
jgi:hypothetical protein